MKPEEIYQKLKEKFGDDIVSSDFAAIDPFIVINPKAAAAAGHFLSAEPDLAFDTLMCLSGVDYPPDRIEVVYHLFSMKWRHKIALKAPLPRDNPSLPTVESIWRVANWHEREAYDLLGIKFEGHSDLRRILLPDDWEGHPLRKDYTAPKQYRGMPV